MYKVSGIFRNPQPDHPDLAAWHEYCDITNPGFLWIPVNDLWDNLAISCITADPNNLQIFYVGTGEASTAVTIYRESSGRGVGIWKTTDGGKTWSLLPSTGNFAYVTDIKVRNEDGNSVIYAGVVSGNYKGSNHQSIPSDGLYRSENGGSSWIQVLPDITGLSVPYAPSDIEIGTDGRIYIGTGRNLESSGHIYWGDQLIPICREPIVPTLIINI